MSYDMKVKQKKVSVLWKSKDIIVFLYETDQNWNNKKILVITIHSAVKTEHREGSLNNMSEARME